MSNTSKHLPYFFFLLIFTLVGGYVFFHQNAYLGGQVGVFDTGSGVLLMGGEQPIIIADVFIDPEELVVESVLDTLERLSRDFPGKIQFAIHLLPQSHIGRTMAHVVYASAHMGHAPTSLGWLGVLRDVVRDVAGKRVQTSLKNRLEEFEKQDVVIDLPSILRMESDLARTKNVTKTPVLLVEDFPVDVRREYATVKPLIQFLVENRERRIADEKKGKKEHKHANFRVYIDGVAIDFTREKYQSTQDKPLNPDVHLHDGNGGVIHFHREKITLQQFFQSIGMDFDGKCLTTDDLVKHCDAGGTIGRTDLKPHMYFYVWRTGETGFSDHDSDAKLYDTNYIPQDLDRIFISVDTLRPEDIGKHNRLEEQMLTVGDDACIYSLKCPERGTPPPESCSKSPDGGCE